MTTNQFSATPFGRISPAACIRRRITPFILMALVWHVLFGDCVQGANPVRLNINVLSGEGAINSPSMPASQRLLVEVVDQDSNPVAGALVTFQLPERGPGAVFANGMKTDVVTTGKDGRAWAGWMRLGGEPGDFDIEVSVAKLDARAATTIRQSVRTQAEIRKELEEPDKTVMISRRDGNSGPAPAASSKKWLWIALLAGGAASGLALGMAGGKGGGAAAAGPVNQPGNTPSGPVVGTPQITVGKP